MKRLIGFTVAVILAFTLTTACASQSKRQYTAACRHECLFVASVLTENYGGRRTVIMTGQLKDGSYKYHCQAAVKLNSKLTYFDAWGTDAIVEVRQHSYYNPTQEFTLFEFLNIYWGRYNVGIY